LVNINLKTLTTCLSTNDIALEGAKAGFDEGSSYLSYLQTKGRGRNDNKWTSLEGNLFLSTIIRPKQEKKYWQQLSLIVGISIIELLVKFGINQKLIELKWPNDILVNNKKISGILLESSDDFIVAGVGLNVKKSPEIEDKWETTNVSDYIDLKMSLQEIAYEVLNQFFFNYKIWNENGFIFFKDKINSFLKYKMKTISIKFNSNTETISGTFLGLGDAGTIKLASGTNIHEYNSIDNYSIINKGLS
jgi:BirA family biotin operon repressor/biotin-[acetyl-CoA-carboxylase] ligase